MDMISYWKIYLKGCDHDFKKFLRDLTYPFWGLMRMGVKYVAGKK